MPKDQRGTSLLRSLTSRVDAITVPDFEAAGDVYTYVANVLQLVNWFESGINIGPVADPINVDLDADAFGIIVDGAIRVNTSDIGGSPGVIEGGYAFRNDPDTGMFSPAAHNLLKLLVAGNEKIVMQQTGNDQWNFNELTLNGTGSSGSDKIRMRTNGTDRLIIENDGTVEITGNLVVTGAVTTGESPFLASAKWGTD